GLMSQRRCEASEKFAILKGRNKVTYPGHREFVPDVQLFCDSHDLDKVFRIREITARFCKPAPGLTLYRLEFHDAVIDKGRLQDRLHALLYMTLESSAAELITI
ncbi:hypothetical protein LTR17_026138, partial [Elasticomyces elasticus]